MTRAFLTAVAFALSLLCNAEPATTVTANSGRNPGTTQSAAKPRSVRYTQSDVKVTWSDSQSNLNTSKTSGRKSRVAKPAPDGGLIAPSHPPVPPPAVAERIKSIRTEERGQFPPPGDFLPHIKQGESSGTIVRDGITIPLRPELLSSTPPKLTIPTVARTTLTNEMRFYAYESHDLPYVYFTLLIKAGDVLDPADKIGLAEVTANTLRSGGSTTRSGDDIDRDLEQIGSELSISADREYVRVGMFALADKKREALAILADLLQNPGFDEKKLEQQKDRELEDIRRENDEPSEISRREFRKLIYGASYPLARTPKPQNITSISRDDVRTFYETYYRPSMISIGVSGDISVADGKNLITEFFGNWKKPAVNVPPIPEPASTDQTTGGIFLIKRDTAQSQIRMGHFGVPRQSAEQYALNVMNVIYGSGGFSSRLMNEVRTRRGYVYGVGGAVTSDDPLGLFFAAASSRPKTTVAAIEAMLEVTQNLLTSKISDGELELAKKDTIYSFISNFDLPREIVWQYMYYDFLGYPASYLPGFVGNVQAVTSEQVIAAAKKYIHPDQLKIFVIGNTDAFDKPLTSIGPVQEMKLESTGGEPVKPAGK